MAFRRASLRAAIAAAALTLAWAAPPAAEAAPLTSYTTKGCAGAPLWKVGYRMYFRSASGATTPRGSRLTLALRAARRFASQVGSFSECGVRARVDVFDEGERVFDGCPGSCGYQSLFPKDSLSFIRRNKLDALFFRYPRQTQDESPGVTAPILDRTAIYYGARYPVDENGPPDPEGRPWRNLVLHEWLHMVVFFYSRANWMPDLDPVHAGCQIEPYRSADLRTNDGPCIASGRYFRDLMRGRVAYQGKRYGITKDVWGRCGTPSNATRKNASRCFRPPGTKLTPAGRRAAR